MRRLAPGAGERRLAPAVPLLSAVALLATVTGCGPASFLITPVSGSRTLEERVIARESAFATRKIAIVDVEGVLSNARSSSLLGGEGYNPVSVFKEKLDAAARDEHVDAIVVRINSPGGGVTASDLMYSELKRFRERTRRPVIACMLDTAASGGYYIACAADRIIAHPTTVTGSIGVIMITPDLSGIMDRLGVQTNVIKSGEMKDAGSPFREMRPQDRAVFQGMIDAMYERFLDVVAAARTSLSRDQLRTLADGRVYLAPQAKDKGLIDEIGTLDDAVAAAKRAAGRESDAVMLVQYARPAEYRPNYYADAPGPAPGAGTQVNLIHVDLPRWLNGTSAEFMYLWSPGL